MKKIVIRVLAITVIGFLVINTSVSGLVFVKCLINGKVRIHYPAECRCEVESVTGIKAAKCCRVIVVKESAVTRTFSQAAQKLNFILNSLPHLSIYAIIQNGTTESILSRATRSHSPPQLTILNQSIVIRDCKLLI